MTPKQKEIQNNRVESSRDWIKVFNDQLDLGCGCHWSRAAVLIELWHVTRHADSPPSATSASAEWYLQPSCRIHILLTVSRAESISTHFITISSWWKVFSFFFFFFFSGNTSATWGDVLSPCSSSEMSGSEVRDCLPDIQGGPEYGGRSATFVGLMSILHVPWELCPWSSCPD